MANLFESDRAYVLGDPELNRVNGGAKTGHGAEQKSATREGMGLKRRERFAPRQLRFSDSWRLPGRFGPAGQT
ncbi:hypothetical protein [Maritimibacter sp. UBA3975]|uniref:hypothetical protein n=1 Tax=Maritimibacter sp. UBA3975 TaxID=1946833 RepID=UPI000C0BAC57|nr:hypothetical protein [Maritimibacter sp. UBA3975]MAM60641.1 hypothetical protein [Maritimibacter sp.]|tara:strand:- start:3250 stop:3468 length:219 start_codon:yes stop_codon:yes gene_type:complete